VSAVGSAGSTGSVGSLDEALKEARDWFKRFIYAVNESDLEILALWVAHTWICEDTYTTPRLLIDSPVPGSGKTTLLEHLGKLSRNPVQIASISSEALLARLTANGITTLLIDEADRSLDPKRPLTRELIPLLNSGYKQGATRPVLVGSKTNFEIVQMPTFAPVAIAGNSPHLPDDTRSRCIVIRLLPDIDGVTEESDWEFLDPEAEELSKKIQESAEAHRELIRRARPELPSGCRNRLKERWSPLKRVAYVAGEEWSKAVDRLIVADVESANEQAEYSDSQESPARQIAKDLLAVYEREAGFIPTAVLVKRLVATNPESWSSSSYYGKELTAQRLGRILHSSFGINSQRVSDGARGYHSQQFQTIWKRLGILANKPTEPTEPTEPAGLL
jgi:hypothetical protein